MVRIGIIVGIIMMFIGKIGHGQPIPFPIACYNFDGNLINDDPTAGIADLGWIENYGTFESGAATCYSADSIYVFGQGDGISLSKTNLPTQTYSLELLFQFTSGSASASGRRRILRFKAENDAGLYLDVDNHLVFQYGNDPADTVKGPTMISEGSWMNISITRDGTVIPPEMIIYYDGIEQIRLATDNSTELLNDFKLFQDNSGGATISKDEHASAKVDYIRFYDQAMDATQIDDLFDAAQVQPDIVITASPSNIICQGSTVTLTATGGNGLYTWSTGETTTSITVTAVDTIDYWVEATFQTPCDRKCYKTNDSIQVIGALPPTTGIAFTTASCINVPMNIAYTGSADSTISTFLWNFGDGIVTHLFGESYDVQWNSAGTKNITLSVTQYGCTSDTLISVIVTDQPAADFSLPATICSAGSTAVSYLGVATGSTIFTWDFDGGLATQSGTSQDYAVVWADLTATTKTVSLTTTDNGCSTTVTKTIDIIPAPTSTFTLPTAGCVSDAVSLNYTGSADPNTASFIWDFDGGSATKLAGTQDYSILWSTGGTKNITLSVTENGCTSLLAVASIDLNNTALFTINSDLNQACSDASAFITFTGSYEPGATLTWNFDGGTATQVSGTDNYNIIWNSTGSKTVTLSIAGVLCPDASESTTLIINPTPIADFTSSSTLVCMNDIITVDFNGVAGVDAIYTWDFADGQAVKDGAGESYKIFWTTGGTRNISLFIEENGCISETVVQQVTVNNDSQFDINVAAVSCITDPVTVTFTGSAETGATLNWDFDGGTGTSIGPEIYEVTWTTSGVKNISLTLIGVACPNDMTTKMITVGDPPVLDFTVPTTICASDQAIISYNGISEVGKTLAWDFDSPTQIDSIDYETYLVKWDVDGPKNIAVTIDNFGCTSSTVLTVQVNPSPTAIFYLDEFVCIDNPTMMGYSGTGTSSSIYNWNFDGGATTTQPGLEQYSISWADPGVKTITLFVSENGCNSLLISDSITVIAPETFYIDAIDTTLCLATPERVSFNGTAESGSTYNWNFDGGVATQINGEQVYDVLWNTTGSKEITLVVIGNYCTSDTIRKNFEVLISPDPAFTLQSATCVNTLVTVDYNVIPNPGWTFTWDFDGGTAAPLGDEDYQLSWTTGGMKTVTLIVDNGGCTTTLYTDSILVNNYAEFELTPNVSVVCQGDPINVKFIGTAEAGASLIWDFDGGSGTKISNDEYDVIWTTTGPKNIKLSILGVTCPDSDTTRIITIKSKPDPLFRAPEVICLGDPALVEFAGAADAGSLFVWDFDQGVETPDVAPESYNVLWAEPGVKQLSLQIDNGGCLSEVQNVPVSVIDFSLLQISADTVCASEEWSVDFSANTLDQAVTYFWDFDGAAITSGSGLGPYTLTWNDFGSKKVALSINGLICGAGNIEYDLYVREILHPEVIIQSDSIYCESDDVLLVPNVLNGGSTPVYKWFVNEQYIDEVDTFQYSGFVNGDRVYALLTSSEVCVDQRIVSSNEVTITISDFAFVGEIEGYTTPLCPGEPVQLFTGSDYAGIQWQISLDNIIWNNLNGETATVLETIPDAPSYYRAIVTDSICVDVSPYTYVDIADVSNIEAGDDMNVRAGYSVQLQPYNGFDFVWNSNHGLSDTTVANPMVAPIETTTYNLSGTTLEGCPSFDSLTVTVTPRLQIPNTITPNDDGANDFWIIDGIEAYAEIKVSIYNRWGKMVFNSSVYEEPWNGFYNQTEIPEGTYFYVIDLKDGFPHRTGSITIMR